MYLFEHGLYGSTRIFIRSIRAIRVHYSAVLEVVPLVCRANLPQQTQSPEGAMDNIVMLWLDNATHPGLSMLDGATHPGLSMLDDATRPGLSMLDGATHPGLPMLDGATHPGLRPPLSERGWAAASL